MSPLTLTSKPTTTRLEIAEASKQYGDTHALDCLSLIARSGEITGIAGPNGAGKSTLVKALAGELSLDSGAFHFSDMSLGTSISIVRPARTAVVHQETSLFPNLTVAENLAMARQAQGWSVPKPRQVDLETAESLGLTQYLDRPVANCSLVVRQLTEIARAFVLEDADVLLLDEPNSALTEDESTLLFQHVLEIKRQNRIILLVTHRLSDLVRYADRVAIVRDGRVAMELSGSRLTESEIARELVVDAQTTAQSEHTSELDGDSNSRSSLSLVVEDWGHPDGVFQNATFACVAGEISAIVGVEGSGSRELLRSLGGFESAVGTAYLDDGSRRIQGYTSQYMPAERQISLFTNLTTGQNLVTRLGGPEIAGAGGWLRRSAMQRLAQGLHERFLVRGGQISSSMRALSGGNQQKVAIAAAIAGEPSVLLLEEPTRGVDVSSKSEIHRLLRNYARRGRVLITFCSEIPEVFELADQVLVVEGGRIVASLRVRDFASVTELAHVVAESCAAAVSTAEERKHARGES